jgi:sortase A
MRGGLLNALAILAVCGCVGVAAPPALADGGIPVNIEIPKIGAHAAIVPLGLDADGNMQAPDDPDTVGWFQPGVALGVPGNVLLDGHVDWGGRLRAFGWLRQLEPGDEFQITDADGHVMTYTVSWVSLYDADNAPLDDIFQQTDDQEVTLITCGGAFDHSIHMYVSRLVVRAIRSSALIASAER